MRPIILALALILTTAALAAATVTTATGTIVGPGTATTGDAQVCSDAALTICGVGNITVNSDANGDVRLYGKPGCVAGSTPSPSAPPISRPSREPSR